MTLSKVFDFSGLTLCVISRKVTGPGRQANIINDTNFRTHTKVLSDVIYHTKFQIVFNNPRLCTFIEYTFLLIKMKRQKLDIQTNQITCIHLVTMYHCIRPCSKSSPCMTFDDRQSVIFNRSHIYRRVSAEHPYIPYFMVR